MINWKRVFRTLIQSASGAAIALITSMSANWSKEAIITSLITFATTVVLAVLMNIKSQVDDEEGEGDE